MPGDYLALHGLLDATKELCSDNRHRLLHNLWGIRRVVLPIVGPRLALSDGRHAYVKEVCEADHVAADFGGRYVPTLADFVGAIAPDPDDATRLAELRAPYASDDEAMRLLLSPYAVTGRAHALLVTHNTWFLSEILPRVVSGTRRLTPRGVPPSELFARMRFELWMDNGTVPPPSAPRGVHHREEEESS